MNLKTSRYFLAGFILHLFFVSGCARAPLRRPSAPVTPGLGRPLAVPAPQLTHRVEHGQTIYRIAKKYRVDAGDLMRANRVQDPALLKVGQILVIPGVFLLPQEKPVKFTGSGMSLGEVRALVGLKRLFSDWRTITLHHSATQRGSARLFHRDHLRRRMGGLFYHFVIGNGSYTRDGEIEVGWRWKKQIKANRPYDIQI